AAGRPRRGRGSPRAPAARTRARRRARRHVRAHAARSRSRAVSRPAPAAGCTRRSRPRTPRRRATCGARRTAAEAERCARAARRSRECRSGPTHARPRRVRARARGNGNLPPAMGEEQRLSPEEQLSSAREAFESGTDFTLAVEEEFALLDPETLDLVNRYEALKTSATGSDLDQHLV